MPKNEQERERKRRVRGVSSENDLPWCVERAVAAAAEMQLDSSEKNRER